jgi:hypothetical protein
MEAATETDSETDTETDTKTDTETVTEMDMETATETDAETNTEIDTERTQKRTQKRHGNGHGNRNEHGKGTCTRNWRSFAKDPYRAVWITHDKFLRLYKLVAPLTYENNDMQIFRSLLRH